MTNPTGGMGQSALLGILAGIDEPKVARVILDCLGLNSRAPPLAPASLPEPTELEFGFEEPWPGDGG